MATRGSVQQSLEEAGIDFIPPEKGVSAFMQELARSSGSPEILVAGKLGPFEKEAFVIPGEQSEKVFFLAGQKATIESLIPGEHLKMKIELTHLTHCLTIIESIEQPCSLERAA